MRCLSFAAMRDSFEYRFTDDSVSWVILRNTWNWEISKWCKMPVFRWIFEIARYDGFCQEYGIVDCQ